MLAIAGAAVVGIAFVCIVAVTLLGTPNDQQSTFIPAGEPTFEDDPLRGEQVGGQHEIPWPTLLTLPVGACLEIEIGGDEPDRPEDAVPISCDQPHRSELFARESLEGEEYPGREVILAAADELCRGRGFTAYVGLPYEQSVLWQTSIYPTEQTWAVGSRAITCFVHGPSPTETTVGSFEGTRL